MMVRKKKQGIRKRKHACIEINSGRPKSKVKIRNTFCP
jgi:hypothetical protein